MTLSWMDAILHSAVLPCRLSYFVDGQITSKSRLDELEPLWSDANCICGEAALSLSRRWQTGGLSSGQGMASSCEGKLLEESEQPASQRDHMRGAGSPHLGLVWISRSVFMHICVCVCVFLANYNACLGKTGSYD